MVDEILAFGSGKVDTYTHDHHCKLRQGMPRQDMGFGPTSCTARMELAEDIINIY